MVTLTVQVAAKPLEVEFVVIDAKFGYNAIIGRGWIHEMEGVTSTLHQVMICLLPDGIKTIDIKGAQSIAQRFYNIVTYMEPSHKEK